MPDLTSDDFRKWLKDPCTIYYMDSLNELKKKEHDDVHGCLQKNEKEEAALHNAGFMVLVEATEIIPQNILDDLKEDE